MATIDGQLILSSAQAFTADAYCTNNLDLSNARDIAEGKEGWSIYIQPTVAADHTTGDETYSFVLRTDDNSSMSSPTDLKTFTLLYSELVTGVILEIKIPAGLAWEQYLALYFDGGGTTPTLTANIWIGPSGLRSSMKKYPNAIDNF